MLPNFKATMNGVSWFQLRGGTNVNEMTLKEVCIAIGVSRRAVQGYEKAGLVSYTRKNSKGYLLYDKDAQERIKMIRLYQKLGFSIKQIQNIIDAPREMLQSALKECIKKLEKQKEEIAILIELANQLLTL